MLVWLIIWAVVGGILNWLGIFGFIAEIINTVLYRFDFAHHFIADGDITFAEVKNMIIAASPDHASKADEVFNHTLLAQNRFTGEVLYNKNVVIDSFFGFLRNMDNLVMSIWTLFCMASGLLHIGGIMRERRRAGRSEVSEWDI